MVVDVLVAGYQPVDALADEFWHAVFDQALIAAVTEAAREGIAQSETLIEFAE